MYQVQKVETLEIPELVHYQTLRRQAEQRKEGVFVAEGERVVRRMIESSIEVISLLLPEKWFQVYEPILAKRPEMIGVYLMDRKQLESLTNFAYYQGVLGLGRVPREFTLEELIARTPAPHFFVAAEGLTKAGNIGTLIRNSAALGVHALISGETCCSPYIRWAVHGSMGGVFKVPVIESKNLVESLKALRALGIQCIAAHPRPGSNSIEKTDFTQNLCLVFGSEGEGLSDAVLAECDTAVEIPMTNGIDSLNIANSAAIFLYEVGRQRSQIARK